MYSSGNATSTVNLLNAFRLFLLDAGFTVNRYVDDGAGKSLSVAKGGNFFNFRATANESINVYPTVTDVQSANSLYAIWLSPSTGYNAGETWFRQPDAPKTNGQFSYCGIGFLTGSMNYHFFAFGNNAFMVVESPTGRFSWLGLGQIAKIGDWGGGQFAFAKHRAGEGNAAASNFSVFGNNWFGSGQNGFFVRINAVDTFTGWASNETPQAVNNIVPLRAGDTLQKSTDILEASPNSFNSLALRLPVGMIITRDGSNNLEGTPFSLFGYIDEFYFVNIRFMNPGSIYSIGGVNYKVFSFNVKADEQPFQYPNYSVGNLGFCLRVD